MSQHSTDGDCNQYLTTDALNADLKERSLKSSRITVASQPLKLVLGIGSTAALARLLTPADFGLLAMATPLLTLVDSLTNLGLETATIQREHLDRRQASAVFWLSLRINALVIGLMVLMAPVLARFYQRWELIGIILVLSVGVLSLCLTALHKSLLKRQMRFEAIAAIDVGSLLAGASLAIGAAWLGWGYWALVLQLVVMQLTQSLASWFMCGWRPGRYVKDALDTNLREMLTYGANLSGFRFLTRIGMELDRILIGYFNGAGALGFYQVAYTWAYFPFEQIYHPLFDVAVSSLSRTQHDPDQYRAYCRRALIPIFAFCMPLLALGFVAAPELILLLLGDQWIAAVPLLQLLAIAVFAGSMYRVTKWLYLSSGQTQRQLRWGVIHTGVMILAVAVGARWEAYGVAVGYTLGICVLTYPSVAFCLKSSPLSLGDFFGTVWRPASASVTAAVIVYASRLLWPDINHTVLNLLFKITTFSLSYLLIWTIFGGKPISVLIKKICSKFT